MYRHRHLPLLNTNLLHSTPNADDPALETLGVEYANQAKGNIVHKGTD